MIIDESIIQSQRTAANPLNSVWVSASAGSGKTKVLTDRVLNLLLSDTRPEKILCLTFTKAAAAEMSNRITDTLKKWTIADDATLEKALQTLTGYCPTPEIKIKARQLFIDVLETPGNMKIMNLHAFCQSVLKRFPIEAGVPPQFDVIDEDRSATLMRDALNQTFLKPEFQKDIDYLVNYLDEKEINNLFKHIMSNEVKYADLFARYGSYEAIKNKLKKKYNLSKYQSENQIICSYFYPLNNGVFSNEEIAKAQELFQEKSAQFFLKDKFILRQKQKENPEAYDILELAQKRNLFRVIETSGYVLHLIQEVVQLYREMKHKQSLLDYGDLISKTRELLSRGTMAQWVMFKMDEGIDHILIDEAQDTSPEQWEIIRLISEEFFAGLGRETDVIRTIFAVGDKKQSIYSFQGADPNEFEHMHAYFSNRVQTAQKTFETVPLNASFRSVSVVLDLVNSLLDNKEARKGVLSDNENAVHTATRRGEGGLVEIWPLVSVEKADTGESWKIPERQKSESAIVILAHQIADRIKEMIENHEILESANRPIEPKDIMILVSKRTGIVSELVRALKERKIPVAGIDRLNLTAHIAIQDLLGVAEFALLPEDDLTLATILKSPLFKVNENQLMTFCVNRGQKTLWEYVQETEPNLSEQLKHILNQADKMPVYEFFAYLLGPLGGRKHFISRLGTEVNEALDEFLNLCLQFEENETPSLQGFLTWFKNRENIIKRDLDQSDLNTVKIMTVHGSKGLQGNIVFLPDAQRLPTTENRFFWDENLPLWIARANLKTPDLEKLFEQEKSATEEEYHRLLYVALTRARDRLYICGWTKPKKPELEAKKKSASRKKESAEEAPKIANWYDLITQSLPEYVVQKPDGIIQMTCPQSNALEPNKSEAPAQVAPITLPAFVLKPAPIETPLSKPLMPSRLAENEAPEESVVGIGTEQALKRGSFIHKLLQYLPEIPPEKRYETAVRLKPNDIEIPNNLLKLFEEDQFQMLFGANSHAETPIVGIVGGRAFSGQIDRLIVLENEVWIVDYKTNRFVPKIPQEVSKSYKIQLFAYRELIKKIFAGKMIRTFLLWTENLSLMEMTNEINKLTLADIELKDKK